MVTYSSAGVNINAGNELVQRIKKMAPRIGGFSGSFPLDRKKYRNPLLVSSTDGVGTKLKLAFMLNRHATVGIDLVAMNVNDLICCGADPLFFLDYFACGALQVDQAEVVVRGIVAGCKQAGCILLGGETAEMPGFYPRGEYDLAGFAVGAVDKEHIINGKSIKAGDAVLGLPSSGVHSNGFSLVRKIFSVSQLKQYGRTLLTPTRIYCKDILPFTKKHRGVIKGIVHITGGGFYDNIPRIFPARSRIVIRKNSWKIPNIFKRMQAIGKVSDREMYRTFNMGIGLVIVASAEHVPLIQKKIPGIIHIGNVEKGNTEVIIA